MKAIAQNESRISLTSGLQLKRREEPHLLENEYSYLCHKAIK